MKASPLNHGRHERHGKFPGVRVCKRAYNFWEPGEIEQAMADGAMRHCARVVGASARMTTEIILEQRAADTGEI